MNTRHAVRPAVALLCAVALVVGVVSPAVATAGLPDEVTTEWTAEVTAGQPHEATAATDAPAALAGVPSIAIVDGSAKWGVVTFELAAPAASTSHRTVRSSGGSFESESRRKIHAVASRRPGVHLAAVADALDRPASTVRYHVRVLERKGRLETRRLNGKRRLFPTDVDSDRYELHAALSDPPTAELLTTLARSEPVSVTELAATTDRSPSTVSHHVDRLVDASLLEYERDGRSVRVTTSPSVGEVLETRIEPADGTD